MRDNTARRALRSSVFAQAALPECACEARHVYFCFVLCVCVVFLGRRERGGVVQENLRLGVARKVPLHKACLCGRYYPQDNSSAWGVGSSLSFAAWPVPMAQCPHKRL